MAEFLKQKEGSIIDVLIYFSQNFKALFYQEKYILSSTKGIRSYI